MGLLSHDLRNPLSALRSNLGYLATVLSGEDEEVSEAIADGEVSCDGLTHLIDNVDLLGQCLRGGELGHRAPSHIGPVAAAAVERCRSAAGSHGVVLELAAGTQRVQGLVEGPRDLLVRAACNLIRNSIQHAPPASTVRVAAEVGPVEIALVVEDRGLAIPAALKDVAFSPQGQVNRKSRSNCRYSRGLGLFSARLAASLCGGRLEVSGAAGVEGNEFRLALPALPLP